VSISKQLQESLESLAPSEAIRVDNVFARMPVHRIARRGHVSIRIIERETGGDGGRIRLYWKVDPNDKVGEPGPLAYRVDTIVVNRCLDEAGRPLPRILALGDLRPIARELGLGGDTNAVKQALKQNAFVGITAKLTYRDRHGNEQWIDNYFTRYNVIFRGGVVDGRHAECAYLVLNDPYYSVLNNSNQRPLDYDFLKRLSPGAQRFYELISPRMYAMFTRGWHYAEMAYSELCTYSTLTRLATRQRIQSQLARIHRVHLAEEYISGVKYADARDDSGGLDLLLRYYPGRKAIAEHLAFNGNIEKGPYRTTRGGMVVVGLADPKRASTASVARNTVPSESDGLAARLAIRFQELRHGASALPPTKSQLAAAMEILRRCESSQELADEAVGIAAELGRESADPAGFPSHMSGVLEGPFIELARAKVREAQEVHERDVARERSEGLQAAYVAAMEERAQRRLAALGHEATERVIDERLAPVLYEYRWYIAQQGWGPDRARVWATPRILRQYGHEGQPTYADWLADRRPEREAA
jgi:hypothetical protein